MAGLDFAFFVYVLLFESAKDNDLSINHILSSRELHYQTRNTATLTILRAPLNYLGKMLYKIMQRSQIRINPIFTEVIIIANRI